MTIDTFLKTGTRRTSGLCWEPEEDAVLLEMCKTCLDEDGGLKNGWVAKLKAILPHRTYQSIRHRIRHHMDLNNVPKSYARKTPLCLPEWSAADAGWMGGIFDGEGCIGMRPVAKAAQAIYLILCTNTDEEIIARVRTLGGRTLLITDMNRAKRGWKTCHNAVVRRHADVVILIKRLMPHVTSSRKRQKLAEALAYIERKKR